MSLDNDIRALERVELVRRLERHDRLPATVAVDAVACAPDAVVEAALESLPVGEHRLSNGWSTEPDPAAGFDLFDERGWQVGWAPTLEAAEQRARRGV